MLTDAQLAAKSLRYRRRILEIIHHAGAGHTGGSLSCIDILNVLYNRALRVGPESFSDPRRDRYVQSKGHCVEALFVVLADRGFFPDSALDTLCQYKSHFVGHPTRKVAGVEQNTGALGHGLPMCVGMALAAKMDRSDFHVYTLLGDGEIAEGSNWEAAMAAAHHKLGNLTAIVDCNRLQITGTTESVMNSEPLVDKFLAFGWLAQRVDGHDLNKLSQILTERSWGDKPRVLIADTIKGKGVSYMENVGRWHHGVPSDAELKAAFAELDEALALLEGVSV